MSHPIGRTLATMILAGMVPTSCRSLDPVDARVNAAIERLEVSEETFPAKAELTRLGARAVPALVAVLENEGTTFSQSFWAIHVLRQIGDKRAVPGLVQVADRMGEVEAVEDVLAYESWRFLSLKARQAIALIVDPASQDRFGPLGSTTAPPGTEHYNKYMRIRKAYYGQVNEWYKAWRQKYKPGDWPGAELVPASGRGPVEAEIRSAIADLGFVPRVARAPEKLARIGQRAVPGLVEVLTRDDLSVELARAAIRLLERIGDRRAVPALVRLADAHPLDDPSLLLAVGEDCWGLIIEEAREAIAIIVDPTNRDRFGPYEVTQAAPGTTEYDRVIAMQREYYRSVNAWYHTWRKDYQPPE